MEENKHEEEKKKKSEAAEDEPKLLEEAVQWIGKPKSPSQRRKAEHATFYEVSSPGITARFPFFPLLVEFIHTQLTGV